MLFTPPEEPSSSMHDQSSKHYEKECSKKPSLKDDPENKVHPEGNYPNKIAGQKRPSTDDLSFERRVHFKPSNEDIMLSTPPEEPSSSIHDQSSKHYEKECSKKPNLKDDPENQVHPEGNYPNKIAGQKRPSTDDLSFERRVHFKPSNEDIENEATSVQTGAPSIFSRPQESSFSRRDLSMSNRTFLFYDSRATSRPYRPRFTYDNTNTSFPRPLLTLEPPNKSPAPGTLYLDLLLNHPNERFTEPPVFFANYAIEKAKREESARLEEEHSKRIARQKLANADDQSFEPRVNFKPSNESTENETTSVQTKAQKQGGAPFSPDPRPFRSIPYGASSASSSTLRPPFFIDGPPEAKSIPNDRLMSCLPDVQLTEPPTSSIISHDHEKKCREEPSLKDTADNQVMDEACFRDKYSNFTGPEHGSIDDLPSKLQAPSKPSNENTEKEPTLMQSEEDIQDREEKSTIRVSGVPAICDLYTIDHFSKYGTIVKYTQKAKQPNALENAFNMSPAQWIIQYKNPESAQKALAENGKTLGSNNPMTVRIGTTRSSSEEDDEYPYILLDHILPTEPLTKEQQENATIYVFGLPESFKYISIEHFRKYGRIVECRQYGGTCEIQYNHPESAQKAHASDGAIIHDYRICVLIGGTESPHPSCKFGLLPPDQRPEAKEREKATIKVSGFPQVFRDHIMNRLSKHGTILKCTQEPEHPADPQFDFVQWIVRYDNPESAQKAVAAEKGFAIGTYILRVQIGTKESSPSARESGVIRTLFSKIKNFFYGDKEKDSL